MLPQQVADGARSAEDIIAKLKSGVDPNAQQAQPVAGDAAANVSDTSPQQANNPNPAQDNWEHKYKVLQGKYNAEVPRLVAENRNLFEKIASLEEEIKRLSSQQQGSQSAQPASDSPKIPESKYKAEDYAEYGDEFKVMYEENVALKNKVAELEALIRNHFAAGQSGAGNQNQQPSLPGLDQEEKFFSDLTAVVPNWEQINVDPEFHSYLVANNLHMKLNQARYALDAGTVIRIFKGFVDQTKNQQAPAQPSARPTISQQVSPQQAGEQGVSGRFFTRAEIAKFFDDKIRGAWRGREQEAEAFEREIFRAVKERRVAA